MRARKLTFGQRVHCPFLRPFFLTAARRSRGFASAARDDRRARRARHRMRRSTSDDLYDQLGMTEAEERARSTSIPATRPPAPPRGSTRSCCRLAPLRRVQRRVAGRHRLHAAPRASCSTRPTVMARFRGTRHGRGFTRSSTALLDALLASYRDWGGTPAPPTIAIVDWRDVPTWTEFEILRDAFVAAGVPTIVCDPRELVFERRHAHRAGHADRSRLSPRAGQRHPRQAAPSAGRSSTPTPRASSASPTRSAASSRTRRRSSPCSPTPAHEHLFSPAELAVIRAHVPWTRVLDDVEMAQGRLARAICSTWRARGASTSCSSRTTSTAARASTSVGR